MALNTDTCTLQYIQYSVATILSMFMQYVAILAQQVEGIFSPLKVAMAMVEYFLLRTIHSLVMRLELMKKWGSDTLFI